MGSSLLPALVLAMFGLSFVFWRERSPEARANGTMTVAIAIMAGFTVLGGLFAAGYAFTDLSVVRAIVTVASYVVPTVGLIWVAVKQLSFADNLFKILWGVIFALSSIRAIAGQEAGELLDKYGPVDAIAVLMFALPLSIWARKSPRVGGWLLLSLGVLPSLLVSFATGAVVSGTSLDVATGTITVVGGLFIYAAGQLERIELAKKR